MKVSLVDVDGRNFPNLALMKIAAYHKAKGDCVDWYMPMFSHPNRIYASKVFTYTQDYIDYSPADPEPIKGGTGYCVSSRLPDEFERMIPNYSIYPDFTQALGFLTRGCIRRCPWCVVPKKEGGIRIVDELPRIATRREVILLDNNFLAAPADFVAETLSFSTQHQIRLDFNQGLDARLVNEENAALLARANWIRYIRFACDTESQIAPLKAAIKKIRKIKPMAQFFVYMLVKDDLKDAERRLQEIIALGATPFAQPYRDLTAKSAVTKEQANFARYCNINGGRLALKRNFIEYYH